MGVDSLGEQTELSLLTHAYSEKSLKNYPQLLDHLLAVKRACAWANSQLGILSFSDYEAIECAALQLGDKRDLFLADVLQGGGGVAVHMNINETLCLQLGDSSWIGKVNASQSTTDVCSTALNVTLFKEVRACKKIIASLSQVLQGIADENMHLMVRGRTCLRDAGLLTFGQRFSGFAALFKRHARMLEEASHIPYSILGATALGTGEGIDPDHRTAYSKLAAEKLTHLTGVPIQVQEDFIDSVHNRDDLFVTASCIESLATSLLKMAKDIRLLASGPQLGFNEIQLPALIKGSSFYQNKVNPTLEETVIQMCFIVLGLTKSAKLGIEHAELDMNVYYMCSTVCLLDALKLINELLPKYIQYSLNQLTINGQSNFYESSN